MIAIEERLVELPIESPELSEEEISNGRLLRLAAFLDELPATRFWFSQWGTRVKLDCHSKGCAVGWASTMPEFAALGLQLESDGVFPTVITPVVLSPSGERLASMFAAPALIFGLSEEEARLLFEPAGQGWGVEEKLSPRATAAEVAAHIRRFVAERQP